MRQIPERWHELKIIAHESPTLHALLRLYENSEMPLEDWYGYALGALAKQNIEFFKKAVDAETRAYPRPFKAPQ